MRSAQSGGSVVVGQAGGEGVGAGGSAEGEGGKAGGRDGERTGRWGLQGGRREEAGSGGLAGLL